LKHRSSGLRASPLEKRCKGGNRDPLLQSRTFREHSKPLENHHQGDNKGRSSLPTTASQCENEPQEEQQN
jgi:hypothetical protein